MILGEAIQRVQSSYSRGVQSKDTRLTSRHIYSALKTGRSTILSQQYNKNQTISDWSYQVLPCVELVKAPIHECPCIPLGCTILRSKHKLPEPVSGLDQLLIRSVSSFDGTLIFDKSTFETVKYDSGNKYTSKKPSYYIKNEYLYITVLKQLKALTITGLFDDFVEAKLFPSICGDCPECVCISPLDMEFPMDGKLMKGVIDIASTELIYIIKQMAEDKQANSSDDTGSQGIIHQPNQQA